MTSPIERALFAACEAEDVTHEPNTERGCWIDGRFNMKRFEAAFLASLAAEGMVLVPNGREANRDNPEGKGACTLDMLHAGMAVMSPARRAAITDRDDAGNLVGDIYRAMIAAASQGEGT